jgi:predicted AAA+ superfamily ATPase
MQIHRLRGYIQNIFLIEYPHGCLLLDGACKADYKVIKNYFETYIERDLRNLSQVHKLNLFRDFVKLCAGRIGQLLNLTNLCNDLGITQSTAKEWLSLLEASYIIYRLRPIHQNINKRIVKTPKLYFTDVGLASYLLGIKSPDQLATHPLRGALYENLVISEIKKSYLNQGLNQDLYFYRDKSGLEIDLVIEKNTTLITYEIKSAATMNKDFVKNINKYEKISNKEISDKYIVYNGEEREAYGAHFITATQLKSSIFKL